MKPVRDSVLRAIAMARIPGFHFSAHFLGVHFDRVVPSHATVSLEAGESLLDIDGSAHPGVVAFLADIGLSASIRSGLDPAVRLATVSMHLQFTGERAIGRLEAEGEFQSDLAGISAKQALSRVTVRSGGKIVAFGSGAFIVLDPLPGTKMHPVQQDRSNVPALMEKDLSKPELAILRAAEAAEKEATAKSPFIRHFWGYDAHATATGASCTMKNGGQVGNRVGHVQGGILVGLAAATANAAMPDNWRLSAIQSQFVSPGEGRMLKARAKVVHQGRQTGVVRTEVTGAEGRRVLDVTSTHAKT